MPGEREAIGTFCRVLYWVGLTILGAALGVMLLVPELGQWMRTVVVGVSCLPTLFLIVGRWFYDSQVEGEAERESALLTLAAFVFQMLVPTMLVYRYVFKSVIWGGLAAAFVLVLGAVVFFPGKPDSKWDKIAHHVGTIMVKAWK